MKKDFAQVFFSVDNDPASGVIGATYAIYRSRAGGSMQLLREVAASELQNNSYTYYDRDLERGVDYSYLIKAKNVQGDVVAVSNKQSI